jgi:hypothetical protein
LDKRDTAIIIAQKRGRVIWRVALGSRINRES